jgi:hypothetical protein
MGHLNINGDLTGIGRCPHCSVANPQLRQVWRSEQPLPFHESPIAGSLWACYRCTTCGQVILIRCKLSLRRGPDSHWEKIDLDVDQIFPAAPTVDESLPPTARKYLSQAFETLHAPDAAAMMAASAVDAMLKAKNYTEGSLYTRIDKAVADHVLTDGMGKWAHAVRLEANNVRHADTENPHISKEQAKQVVEFASALGDFLYVLTAKVNKGVQAAEPTKIEK